MAHSVALSHSLAVSAHEHTSADKEKTPASSKRIISLTDARSLLYIASRNAFFPSRESSKVSINHLKCVIFHLGFTLPSPGQSYYWFFLPFKIENISIHIFCQLERKPPPPQHGLIQIRSAYITTTSVQSSIIQGEEVKMQALQVIIIVIFWPLSFL